MRPPLHQIRKSATRHFQQHGLPAGPAETPAALRECAHGLMERFNLPQDDAHDVAMSAFSEIAGRATGFSIDTKLTTEHLVFINDHHNGTRHAIALIDLVRMLGPREIKRTAANS